MGYWRNKYSTKVRSTEQMSKLILDRWQQITVNKKINHKNTASHGGFHGSLSFRSFFVKRVTKTVCRFSRKDDKE